MIVPAELCFRNVTLFRNGVKQMETSAVKADPVSGSSLGTTPIRMRVPLGNLQAGEYDAQVTVLDPAIHRLAVWRSQLAMAR